MLIHLILLCLPYITCVTEISQLPDGMKCEVSSVTKDRLKFNIEIPGSTWFSIGYGYGMNYVDMVLFQPDAVSDLWSTGMWTPGEDSI